MIYEIVENKFLPKEPKAVEGGYPIIGVFGLDRADDICRKFGIDPRVLDENVKGKYSKFESHEDCDYINVNVPMQDVGFYRTACCIRKGQMIIFSSNSSEICQQLESSHYEGTASIDTAVFVFMQSLTITSGEIMEDVENDIADMESNLILNGKTDCVEEILKLSRRLAVQKRYFSQLYDIYDNMLENENGLLSSKLLKHLKTLHSKVDRLYNEVLTQREHVTQVRESYQAQVDINLNGIMKVFTVITTIFLPLTLIVGWYGMNVKMPEYA